MGECNRGARSELEQEQEHMLGLAAKNVIKKSLAAVILGMAEQGSLNWLLTSSRFCYLWPNTATSIVSKPL
jgi:hypothetical protein